MGVHIMYVHTFLPEIEAAIAHIVLFGFGLVNHLVLNISNETWSNKLGAILPTVACLGRNGSNVDHNGR